MYSFEYLFKNKNKGFTLIELLVVISIIGLLSSVVLASLNTAREKSRDGKRLSEMKQIQLALEMYYDENGVYPTSDSDGCGGWDIGNQTYPLLTNIGTILPQKPRDPTETGTCSGYRYYRYNAEYASCDADRGAFYVLGVTDMEGSANPHPASLGWSCVGRNWQNEMEWVTGGFEH